MITDPREKVISLFHQVYRTSKAYKDFIDSHKLDISQINTPLDINKIPVMDKQNYIKKYPIEDRLYNGKKLNNFYMICSSSGSSGEPTLWPRDFSIDSKLELKKEQLYEEHFQISQKSTLFVITFGLGVWTAGMLTAKLTWAAAKNNKISVITPGMDKQNITTLVSKLHKYYDQTVIVGYSPFISDFIEYAKEQGLNLIEAKVKILCTSERFSERWRNIIAKEINDRGDRYSVVGFYACSDTGILGAETKFTIDLLNNSSNNLDLCRELFNSIDSPSLVMYDPSVKYLESIDNEILITSEQPMPLIRYNIHDRGGLLDSQTIKSTYEKYGIAEAIPDNRHYVYVFGRSDAVKVTANIYIEDIKYCLEKSSLINKLSGSFKYGAEKTEGLKNRLKIIIFLKPGENLTSEEKNKFEKEFYENLLVANNDFKMIQEGINIEKFNFVYEPDNPEKYASSKLKYFL